VEDDRRQQAEAQVEQPEPNGRDHQLDHARVGRLGRVVGVTGAEDHSLQDESAYDPQALASEASSDQGGPGQGHGAEQALLPEAGLQRGRHRGQPREVGSEHVGVEQRLGGRPPAEMARGDEVEHDLVGEEHRHQQVPGHGRAEDGTRAGDSTRPRSPQLHVVAERAPAQALGGHEGRRHDRPHADELDHDPGQLLEGEGGRRDRSVVRQPQQRPLVEAHQDLQEGHEEAPCQGPLPQHPPCTQEQEEPERAASAQVEHDHDDARADGDAVVGRAHLLVATVECLRHLDEVGELGEAVARDHQPQAVAALTNGHIRPLVGQRVICAATRSQLLGRLHQLVGTEVDAPQLPCRPLGHAPGFVRLEAGPRLVFGYGLDETVWLTGRGEADRRLVGLVLAEVADLPGVW